jgi:hypothetical protein
VERSASADRRAQLQRSQQLMEADRNRPRRRHDQPLTPAAQLLRWRGICRENRQRIEALQQQCDPMALLGTIRWNQAALVNGESEPSTETDRSASNQELNAFLISLLLWRQSRTCQARRMGCAKAHLPHAGGSLANRPAGDATAGAGAPWSVSRQPAQVAEADG